MYCTAPLSLHNGRLRSFRDDDDDDDYDYPKIVYPPKMVTYFRNNQAVSWLGIQPATAPWCPHSIHIKDRKVKSRFATTHSRWKTSMSKQYGNAEWPVRQKNSVEYSINGQYGWHSTTKQSLYNSFYCIFTLARCRTARLYTKLCHCSHGTTVNTIPIHAITAVSVIPW